MIEWEVGSGKSGVGAYLSKWVFGEGAYSRGGGYSGVGAYSIIYGTVIIIVIFICCRLLK